MRRFLGYWSWRYPTYITYMLQASEYKPAAYIAWWLRTSDFRYVMKRRILDSTTKATLIRIALRLLYMVGIFAICYSLYVSISSRNLAWLLLGLLLFVVWPLVTAFSVLGLVWLGEVLIQRPKERAIQSRAAARSATLSARKIAIAGSYGKTSMKEMLQTILSVKLNVRATPGNKNTLAGNSFFIQNLLGDEDVLVFEFGESYVGDIAALCQLVQPQIGIITGITEAHLDTFDSQENLVGTIYELSDYLGEAHVYKNADSDYIREHIVGHDRLAYSHTGVNGWTVTDIHTSLQGVSFIAHRDGRSLPLVSGLIGAHHVGPLITCVDIAHRLGLNDEEIATGVARTKPFEHRMQTYILHGATIIDDTYNGNPVGIRSGLSVLRTVEARRRIYVTPGLVGLGEKSDTIHEAIGREIARSADVVVLMKNSTTDALRRGVERGGFKGRLILVGEPLEFYQNIDQFVAAGDVVLMQNDWTDNYT